MPQMTEKLTIICHCEMMRRACLPVLCLMLAQCAPAEPDRSADTRLIAADPVMARALNDPLMSDPDLASRNEANAAIGFADSSALPVIDGSLALAQQARDAARLELLDDGPIPPLPEPREGERGKALGPMAGAAQLLAALGAPQRCVSKLRDDFALAATLPKTAAIMPMGMVVQAGGGDSAGCRVRIIRYTTAAAPEDVLQYHFTRAQRAGLKPVRYASPEDSVASKGKDGTVLVVHVRPTVHGLTAVDLLYRAAHSNAGVL
jgi:hypothetical protein